MNKNQARALLALIADLYQIIQVPDPEPSPSSNGRVYSDVEHAQPVAEG